MALITGKRPCCATVSTTRSCLRYKCTRSLDVLVVGMRYKCTRSLDVLVVAVVANADGVVATMAAEETTW